MKIACKYHKDNIVYYFEKKEHLERALNGTPMSLMSFAMVAIYRDTNSIIKCRYELEDVLDSLLEREVIF